MTTSEEVLAFWFDELEQKHWYLKDAQLDERIRQRFGELHRFARAGGLDGWASDPNATLALIIVLDQFPRNMFRGQPESFAADAKAREVARFMLDKGWDQQLDSRRAPFAYMPFEHSERMDDQQFAVDLFRKLDGPPALLEYARAHHKIIERFGRFPHRNKVLGRQSTDEEVAFLLTPGSSF